MKRRLVTLAATAVAVLSLGACHPLETITVCNKAAGPAHSCWDIQR